MSPTKKLIAKEWLVFLVAMVCGFVVFPAVISLVGKGTTDLRGFYKALFTGDERVIAWAVGVGPYCVWQLIRSLFWAIRTVRTK